MSNGCLIITLRLALPSLDYLFGAVGAGPWLERGVGWDGVAGADGVGRRAEVVVVAVRHRRLVGPRARNQRALVLRLLLPPGDAEGGGGLLVALQGLTQHGRDVVHIGGCNGIEISRNRL